MNAKQTFISILKSELTRDKSQLNLNDIVGSVKEIYFISKRQGLENIVAEYLSELNIPSNDDISKNFTDLLMKSMYQTVQMKYELSVIEKIFNENKIKYIPLKGAVIRNYYPKDYMRKSGDIDILVSQEDIETALAVLSEQGFVFKERSYHDIFIITPQKNLLELHFSLLETKENIDDILVDAWSYAIQDKGYRYKFTDEFFLFYFLAHMVYHFSTSGCGIRFLCDLWIIENKMGIKLDISKNLLERAGIYKFSKEMFRLSHICFDGEQTNEISDAILTFMLSGGICGKGENTPIISSLLKNKGTVLYIIDRVFPNYKVIREIYPIIKKVPILLPFAWIYRIICKFKKGKAKNVTDEIKKSKFFSKEEIENIKTIFNYLEL